MSLLLVVFIFAAAQPIKNNQRTDVYRGIAQYLEQSIPSKAPIAYFSSPRSYLLYGQNLNKTVLHRLPNLDEPGRWVRKFQRDGVNWVQDRSGHGFAFQSLPYFCTPAIAEMAPASWHGQSIAGPDSDVGLRVSHFHLSIPGTRAQQFQIRKIYASKPLPSKSLSFLYESLDL